MEWISQKENMERSAGPQLSITAATSPDEIISSSVFIESKSGGAVLAQGDQDVSSAPNGNAVSQQEWNNPKINIWRTLAACFGFLIMGANDGAYGALIPYLEDYYNVNHIIISLIFLSPCVGYTASAFLNNWIHMRLGQRGVAFIGPGARLISYVTISQHPPYSVLVLAFILAGFGNGLEDAAWNAWIGNMRKANEILGFLHGAYGLGGTLSPLIATSIITQAQFPWYSFYYVMIGAVMVEWVWAVVVFWVETGAKFRIDHPRTKDRAAGRTVEALTNKVTWITAFFLLLYVGIEVAVGGWVVVFMLNIRDATPFAAGMSATGFWLGITVGRCVLGFVTPKIGEKLAILIYISLALILHLIFYLVTNLPLSFVLLALEGVCLGPLFPAAVVAATILLPPDLHVAAVGFAAAFGATGACVIPFAVGAIAQAKGVQVLMPIVLAFLIADGAVWALLPSLKVKKPDMHEKEGGPTVLSNDCA